ncbi:MAG: hypothetical protein MUP62_04255, partial [Dehalococcoidia bacterium]|nr:hypothetical protein [Dehalococcoidia bacterium]
MRRIGSVAFEDDRWALLLYYRVRDGNGPDERLGIRMHGSFVEVLDEALLNDLAKVHHNDACTYMTHDAEVVRYEKV